MIDRDFIYEIGVLYLSIAFQIKQNFECRSHNSTIFNETKLLLVEPFDEMQTAANQRNRGEKRTFFSATNPKSENPTVLTVGFSDWGKKVENKWFSEKLTAMSKPNRTLLEAN